MRKIYAVHKFLWILLSRFFLFLLEKAAIFLEVLNFSVINISMVPYLLAFPLPIFLGVRIGRASKIENRWVRKQETFSI